MHDIYGIAGMLQRRRVVSEKIRFQRRRPSVFSLVRGHCRAKQMADCFIQ